MTDEFSGLDSATRLVRELPRNTDRAALVAKPWRPWVSITERLNRMPLWLIHANKLYILKRSIDSSKRLRTYKSAKERVAKIADSEAIANCSGKAESKVRTRLEKGDICIISEVNGELVGYIWMSKEPLYQERAEGVVYKTGDKTAWLYDGFVIPEFRIKGIWLNLQYALLAYVATRDKQHVACSIEYDNVNSINTHLRFAYVATQTVICLHLLGLGVCKVKDIETKRSIVQISWWGKYFNIEV